MKKREKRRIKLISKAEKRPVLVERKQGESLKNEINLRSQYV
ncbi:hypothetical protein EV06_1505 [Prochlorococcus sp. MIT 0602]|nr:hypothetical protein EV06_1505 [Prochlorococcus sp. MIT 0602]KGG17170.1 hypothetical protein EV07_0605 [Prochlorococcus sp. MIT 0603]